ncbi:MULTISPECIES: RNA polymerase sigma factor SigB [Bacillus cereus group]|uniref:RNA polymerase sigma factor SigB n=1 Tax=Bacillus cereus group TaxID=86661 RepID=UPI000977ABD1|nr:RNA polymerase sigma factor SigB [Bacillus cereus]ONH02255.1 RNA polymerase sigma factor SigB [Bacillus cereus]
MMEIQSQPTNLTKEDVIKLIAEFQQNQCDEAQERLVQHYKNLVYSIAYRYSKGGPMHEDIIQVGMLGLLGAIRRYDYSIGNAFEPFAIPTIVGEIKKYLRDKTWGIHVPRRIKDLGGKIKLAIEELTDHLQRSPKIIEIADHLGLSEEEVLEIMDAKNNYRVSSLDDVVENASDGSSVARIESVGEVEQGYEQTERRLVLKDIFNVLNETEKSVIHYIFEENLNQKDTGERLGISQMHVSRIKRQAISKLKQAAFLDT